MWSNKRPLNAWIAPRPARVAYLIPDQPSNTLLSALVAESLSRWGGRRTPFIPIDGKTIAPAYFALLNLWDADIIYSYVKLSKSMENRLYDRFAPAEIRSHEGLEEHQDERDFRPDYSGNFNFVSSLSLLPFFARRAQSQGAELPEIVDKEHWAEEDQDLDDSFGIVSNSCIGESLLPHARRLSLRPKQVHGRSARQLNTNEVSYVEDREAFVAKIAEQPSILTLSRLADMLCPYLNHLARGGEGWDEHLTIVIGDTPQDRLLFWNAQHRYPALGGIDDLPVLRLSPKRFENGPPNWLRKWISRRNSRHLQHNQAPSTILRSCSLPKSRLDEIADQLGANLMVMVSSEHHATPCLFEPCEKWVSENRKGAMQRAFPSIWILPRTNGRTSVRFQDNQLELPTAPPWHVREFASVSLSRGVWAADLKIERSEDHSRFSNRRHVWRFPRRLRLEAAVRFENYVPMETLVLPPPPRPTESGDLTIWDSVTWPRPILTLPSDYYSFTSALSKLASGSPSALNAYASGSSDLRFDMVTLSDKGRDLLGVFQFFGSLPEALAFLTNPIWLKTIGRLSPEESAQKKKYVDDLAERLKTSAESNSEDSIDYERIARRALSLASRSFSTDIQLLKSADFDKLLEWASEGESPKARKEIKENLIQSVTYLRDCGFLWQGFKWTCSFCQHHNWVPLERLEAVTLCEICRTSKSSPVMGGLNFRLNPFVLHAFGSTSAQGSVIWCIDQLASRATSSFAFTPALNLYRGSSSEPVCDLDLAANVDGKVYLVEVKSSFAGVEPSVLDQLKFLALELRPDVVMLAVQANMEENKEIASMLAAFQQELEQFDSRFEVLTLDRAHRSDLYDKVPLPLARKMIWSA